MKTATLLVIAEQPDGLSVKRNAPEHYALRKQCQRLAKKEVITLEATTPTTFLYRKVA